MTFHRESKNLDKVSVLKGLSDLSWRTSSAFQKSKVTLNSANVASFLRCCVQKRAAEQAMTSEVSPRKIRKAASALPRSLDGSM